LDHSVYNNSVVHSKDERETYRLYIKNTIATLQQRTFNFKETEMFKYLSATTTDKISSVLSIGAPIREIVYRPCADLIPSLGLALAYLSFTEE